MRIFTTLWFMAYGVPLQECEKYVNRCQRLRARKKAHRNIRTKHTHGDEEKKHPGCLKHTKREREIARSACYQCIWYGRIQKPDDCMLIILLIHTHTYWLTMPSYWACRRIICSPSLSLARSPYNQIKWSNFGYETKNTVWRCVCVCVRSRFFSFLHSKDIS